MSLGKEAERSRRWFERTESGGGSVACFLGLGSSLMAALTTESLVLRLVMAFFVFVVCGLAGAMIGYPMARIRRDLDDATKEILDLRAQLAAGGGKTGKAPDRPGS